MKTKSQMRRLAVQGYVPKKPLCWECAKLMGGVAPTYPVTCHGGTCPYCGESDVTLVPVSDFAWPGAGVKAVWD